MARSRIAALIGATRSRIGVKRTVKVEANHLRILPLPLFDHGDVLRLAELGLRLAKLLKTQETPTVLQEIDAMVIRPVAKVLGRDQPRVLSILRTFVDDSRARGER